MDFRMQELIDKLVVDRKLDAREFALLLREATPGIQAYAATLAAGVSRGMFCGKVYVRGLIEFTNHCKNDCLYCGIRRSNTLVERYRLERDEILSCCANGYELGFRTFVLQGGEDGCYGDELLLDIVSSIRRSYPDCAITLSVGERSRDSYQRLFQAGANRYLLRHETASAEHYAKLHPASMSLAARERCLWDLKEIGFQTGSGFMVGSPFQTPENLAADLLFLHDLEPEMAGIGPFIPHHDTPFASFPAGSVRLTLFILSLVRLMFPRILIPATTALGTLDPRGREKGVLAGANVLMPNLSPAESRSKYAIYDNKIHSGLEAAEYVDELRRRMADIGYELSMERGDYC